jgi:hypothetical protein
MGFGQGAAALRPKGAGAPTSGDPDMDVVAPAPAVEQKPVELDDPALRASHQDGSMVYQRYAGDLFLNGVSAADVEQGSIADCYLVAALAAAAHAHPKVIEQGIKASGNGGFKVRFFERTYSGNYKEIWVDVDADLPTQKGGSRPAYARSTEKNERGMELWPAIYEKAYAAWKKGYDKMGEGGSSQAALEALVGARVSSVSLGWTPADQVWKKLEAMVANGKAGTAGTHGKDRDDLYKDIKLYAWHAYTVMGIEQTEGERFVILRNPWARTEPGNDGKDDGVFRLTLTEFMKYYDNMSLES